MIPFARPLPPFPYDPVLEARALSEHFEDRGVPRSRANTLLLATWNIANLGLQGRSDQDLALVAEVLRPFELVAVQEVAARAHHLVRVVELLGPAFDYVMTDPSANNERLAYIFRRSKVRRGRLAGELALDPTRYPKRTVRVPTRRDGVTSETIHKDVLFRPFSRTPFLHAFEVGGLQLTLANAHLYRGRWKNGQTPREELDFCRRVLETYALARWAAAANKKDREAGDVVVLGDLNIPKMSDDDPAQKALVRFKLQPPEDVTRTGGTNLNGDATYDQIVFAPGELRDRIESAGVFDFDNAVFRTLWKQHSNALPKMRAVRRFNRYVRFHLSDHRPTWALLRTD
jgi:hypothetical protein